MEERGPLAQAVDHLLGHPLTFLVSNGHAWRARGRLKESSLQLCLSAAETLRSLVILQNACPHFQLAPITVVTGAEVCRAVASGPPLPPLPPACRFSPLTPSYSHSRSHKALAEAAQGLFAPCPRLPLFDRLRPWCAISSHRTVSSAQRGQAGRVSDPEEIYDKKERIGKGSFGEVFRGYATPPRCSPRPFGAGKGGVGPCGTLHSPRPCPPLALPAPFPVSHSSCV